MMPGMDGFEVIRRLKADDSTDKIPIVILTAKGSQSDMMEGWDSGTDLYLLKPVMLTDLIGFVNCILA
jgi:DNA-binding response OmpR family regulator